MSVYADDDEQGMDLEYRIAALQARLASGELGQLGMRIETHGAAVSVCGTVPTDRCREQLLDVVHAELSGVPVHADIVIVDVSAPGYSEDLTGGLT
ncbi:hypothetical protein [Streptomyces sp. NPDC102487]|uniref:hypothetical protein n=1 Tax=Streptomyces sp. NPDC102487 TaxID=3366182 RepID=UPI003808138B